MWSRLCYFFSMIFLDKHDKRNRQRQCDNCIFLQSQHEWKRTNQQKKRLCIVLMEIDTIIRDHLYRNMHPHHNLLFESVFSLI